MSRVIHFEIHAKDCQRAIRFYERVLGWKFTQWGTNPYWLITTGPDDQPGINGGLMQRKGDVNGSAIISYVCTVQVDSVDTALETALASGGTLALAKQPVPGVGWLVYVKDTEENIFGMMQNDPSAH